MRKVMMMCSVLLLVSGCARLDISNSPHSNEKKPHKPQHPSTVEKSKEESQIPVPTIAFNDAIMYFYELYDDSFKVLEISYHPFHESGIYEIEAVNTKQNVEIVFDSEFNILSENSYVVHNVESSKLEHKGFDSRDLEHLVDPQDVLRNAMKINPGNIIELQLEREHGLYVYSIELTHTSGKEFKLDVNAEDGTVLKQSLDS